MHRSAPAQPNLSLQNGLACLLRLAGSLEPIGSRQLARDLALEHTRVNRLLGTLAHLGLARQTPERKYTVGPGINILAAMSLRRSSLLRAALPCIQSFQAETGYGAALGMLWQRRVCYLYHGGPADALTATITGQDLFPAEVSSIGKVLLAELPADALAELYAHAPDTLPALLNELSEVRDRGYAIYEHNSVAVAVGNPAIAGLAAMQVPGTRHREIVDALNRAAGDIAAALGNQP